ALKTFPSTLPTRRDSAYAAWVSISVGCNNTCTFCIVPSLRGKERDRRPGDVLAEVEAVVAQRSEEHTSELQSRFDLVCRLLLESSASPRPFHSFPTRRPSDLALKTFPSTLPTRRDSAYAAWVSISVGCNNTCTFCIVPSLRGKERDRRPGDVLAEVEAVVAQGAVEVTLVGQNVNSYGVGFGDRGAFAKLLRACGTIEGLERIRFTSPHPAAFTDDV